MSSYGVMRGLHFQASPFPQSKLVRCVKGAVLDVDVDISKVALPMANMCQYYLLYILKKEKPQQRSFIVL